MRNPQEKVGAIICGPPCSGNKLLYRLMRHSGAKAIVYHGPGVKHAQKRGAISNMLTSCTPYILVPTRDPLAAQLSFEGEWEQRLGAGLAATNGARQLNAYVGLLHMPGVPAMVVRYEDLVSDPERWGRRIVEFCGLEWVGWPEDIYDGNEKYNHPLVRGGDSGRHLL